MVKKATNMRVYAKNGDGGFRKQLRVVPLSRRCQRGKTGEGWEAQTNSEGQRMRGDEPKDRSVEERCQ